LPEIKYILFISYYSQTHKMITWVNKKNLILMLASFLKAFILIVTRRKAQEFN